MRPIVVLACAVLTGCISLTGLREYPLERVGQLDGEWSLVSMCLMDELQRYPETLPWLLRPLPPTYQYVPQPHKEQASIIATAPAYVVAEIVVSQLGLSSVLVEARTWSAAGARVQERTQSVLPNCQPARMVRDAGR